MPTTSASSNCFGESSGTGPPLSVRRATTSRSPPDKGDYLDLGPFRSRTDSEGQQALENQASTPLPIGFRVRRPTCMDFQSRSRLRQPCQAVGGPGVGARLGDLAGALHGVPEWPRGEGLQRCPRWGTLVTVFTRRREMKEGGWTLRHWIVGVVMSTIFVAAAVARHWWSSIDQWAIILLVLGSLPWLTLFFKKIKLPGGIGAKLLIALKVRLRSCSLPLSVSIQYHLRSTRMPSKSSQPFGATRSSTSRTTSPSAGHSPCSQTRALTLPISVDSLVTSTLSSDMLTRLTER